MNDYDLRLMHLMTGHLKWPTDNKVEAPKTWYLFLQRVTEFSMESLNRSEHEGNVTQVTITLLDEEDDYILMMMISGEWMRSNWADFDPFYSQKLAHMKSMGKPLRFSTRSCGVGKLQSVRSIRGHRRCEYYG